MLYRVDLFLSPLQRSTLIARTGGFLHNKCMFQRYFILFSGFAISESGCTKRSAKNKFLFMTPTPLNTEGNYDQETMQSGTF